MVAVPQFHIAGRGTAVLGVLSGTTPSSPVQVSLDAHGEITVVPEVWVEFVLTIGGGERLALVLVGIDMESVPSGSILRPAELS